MGKWINADEELPKDSGKYLVVKAITGIDVLDYSAKYKLFNAHDFNDCETAEKCAIDVLYWQPLPKLPRELQQ